MVPFPRRLKADLALAFVTLIWGSTFVVVKEALGDASPLVFVTFRFTFAFLLLAALFHRRLLHSSSGILPAGIVTGGFLCGGYVFQTIGLQYTTPTKSAFITALSVVLVPLLVVALFRQRLRAPAVVGVAVAFCGLYFLTMPSGKLVAEMGDLLTLGLRAGVCGPHCCGGPLRSASRCGGAGGLAGRRGGGVCNPGNPSRALFRNRARRTGVDSKADPGSRDHCRAGHRSGIFSANLGAADYDSYAYRHHLHTGTRLCRTDFLPHPG